MVVLKASHLEDGAVIQKRPVLYHQKEGRSCTHLYTGAELLGLWFFCLGCASSGDSWKFHCWNSWTMSSQVKSRTMIQCRKILPHTPLLSWGRTHPENHISVLRSSNISVLCAYFFILLPWKCIQTLSTSRASPSAGDTEYSFCILKWPNWLEAVLQWQVCRQALLWVSEEAAGVNRSSSFSSETERAHS